MTTTYFYYFVYFLICYSVFQLIYLKEIWVFFIGNIISNLVYILLKIILIDKKNLHLIQKTLNWFFIEHIYEDYKKNTGKFFLTNRDFRQKFILNSFIFLRNVIFWSYITTLFEFISLFLIYSILNFILFLYFFSDKDKKFITKQLRFFIFYCFFSLIILFKFIEYTYLDLHYILKPILFFVLVIIQTYCIFVYFYIIWNFIIIVVHTFNSYYNRFLIFFILKILISSFLIIICSITIINTLIFYHMLNNNFLQEFMILIISLFAFIYYIFKFYAYY